MSGIQYTIRGVPPELDARLRQEARTTGKTLNALVVETLEHEKLSPANCIHEDLDWFVGSEPGSASDADSAMEWLDAPPAESE